MARRNLRRPGHHHAHRVRVLPLHLPPNRRRMEDPPPGRHPRHPVRLLTTLRPDERRVSRRGRITGTGVAGEASPGITSTSLGDIRRRPNPRFLIAMRKRPYPPNPRLKKLGTAIMG